MSDTLDCVYPPGGWPERDPEVPEFCQQFACREPVETWCPLCRAYFCKVHDELYPRRLHDCLKGKAEDVA